VLHQLTVSHFSAAEVKLLIRQTQ